MDRDLLESIMAIRTLALGRVLTDRTCRYPLFGLARLYGAVRHFYGRVGIGDDRGVQRKVGS